MKVNTETQRRRALGFSVPLCLCVSILVHGLLAVALGVYLDYAPRPDVLATLDLSSVELSFAEKEEETAAVAPALPAPPPRPKAEEKPPEAKSDKPLPPDPAAPKLREPKEDPQKFIPHHSSFTTPEPAAPRQARVDAPPRPKRDIRPDYPKGARQRGEQGDVVVEIRVTAEGTVAAADVVTSCGFAELDEAAVRAVKAAKFAPARSGREPVASTARLKLSFKLK